VRFVIQRELALLRPDADASTVQVEALLHPDFGEIDAAGRRLGRREVIAAFGRRAPRPPGNGGPPAAGPAAVSGLTGIRLSTTVILVSYLSDSGGRHVRCSSLWLKTGPSWRRYFHQATPVAAG